ncbi:MAG: FG-GAP-like repeat-containing protein, partial [bacterium]
MKTSMRLKASFLFYLFFMVSASYAQIPFSPQIIIEDRETDMATSVYAADIDGDGDMDVLSASGDDNKIAWYENMDGAGTFGPQKIITTSAQFAYCVYAADIDGDGDIDALSASWYDDKIAWYENTDGRGTFGPQRIITTLADDALSVYAADIDGDGDMDVLSASFTDDKIAWYENTDGRGAFGSQKVITTSADYAQSVFAADIDGDGDMDVLSASGDDNKIAWYENTDGRGTFGPQIVITTSAAHAKYVYAADLDGDGDIDVLSASWGDHKIAWYENTDGAGTFGPQQIISTLADNAMSVYAADLDGDGDLDVLSASWANDRIAWYENTDGAGAFGPQQIISTQMYRAASVYAADLDGDGDMDVLSASWYDFKTAWYKNTDGLGTFGPQQIITTTAHTPTSVYAADLDGDSDMDVLSASWDDDRIAWYENMDGTGDFRLKQVITTSADAALSVYAADLDGDGDIDVLSASANDDKIAWYENTDGRGSFGPQKIITTSADFAHSVYAADLDGDGDFDILSASANDDKIAWYENTDGHGAFGPQKIISTSADGAYAVYPCDIDGDGDFDVLSASLNDDKIAWYKNTNGAGSFGPQNIITTYADGAYAVAAADLDGDGDSDVLSASTNDDEIAWYQNTDGAGNFGSQKIITMAADGAHSVFAADLDGDGDKDILSASAEDDKIALYRNINGAGSFSAQQVITTSAKGAFSVFAADLDGDGDFDILSASAGDDKISWYRNLTNVIQLPDIAVNPASKNYGDVTVGTSSSQTFTFTNEGTADLNVASTTIVGSTDFTIQSGGGAFTLTPSASREVRVNFTPSDVGAKSATLRFLSNDPDENPLNVPLSGNGTTPDISVTPASKNYGDVTVGTSSAQIFTVTNEGTADLSVTASTIVGSGNFII